METPNEEFSEEKQQITSAGDDVFSSRVLSDAKDRTVHRPASLAQGDGSIQLKRWLQTPRGAVN